MWSGEIMSCFHAVLSALHFPFVEAAVTCFTADSLSAKVVLQKQHWLVSTRHQILLRSWCAFRRCDIRDFRSENSLPQVPPFSSVASHT